MQGLWAFGLILFLYFPVWGDQCLNTEDVAGLRAEFIFEVWDEELRAWEPWEEWNICDDKEVVYSVLKGLLSLKSLPPLTKKIDHFDQGILEDTPFQFFYERVRTIRLDTHPQYFTCSPGSGVIGHVSDKQSNTFYFCPEVVDHGELRVLGSLVHESRHLLQHEDFGDEKKKYSENNSYLEAAFTHKLCARGLNAGNFNCDESLSDGGAYATETEFYTKVARTDSIPDRMRERARSFAVGGILGNFNKIPGGSNGALLEAEDGGLVFYDLAVGTSYDILKEKPEGSVMMDIFTPSFLSPKDRSVKSYAGSGKFVETRSWIAHRFRNYPKEEAAELLDAIFGINFDCLLFKTYVLCTDFDVDAKIEFPKDFQPVQMSIVRGMPDGDLVFLVDREGEQHALPTFLPLSDWKWSDIEVSRSLGKFKSIGLIVSGLRRFGITMDGTFVEQGSDRLMVDVESLKHRKFSKIRTPFFWSPIIEEF